MPDCSGSLSPTNFILKTLKKKEKKSKPKKIKENII
jgi:hypothetical protein